MAREDAPHLPRARACGPRCCAVHVTQRTRGAPDGAQSRGDRRCQEGPPRSRADRTRAGSSSDVAARRSSRHRAPPRRRLHHPTPPTPMNPPPPPPPRRPPLRHRPPRPCATHRPSRPDRARRARRTRPSPAATPLPSRVAALAVRATPLKCPSVARHCCDRPCDAAGRLRACARLPGGDGRCARRASCPSDRARTKPVGA